MEIFEVVRVSRLPWSCMPFRGYFFQRPGNVNKQSSLRVKTSTESSPIITSLALGILGLFSVVVENISMVGGDNVVFAIFLPRKYSSPVPFPLRRCRRFQPRLRRHRRRRRLGSPFALPFSPALFTTICFAIIVSPSSEEFALWRYISLCALDERGKQKAYPAWISE